MVNIPAGTNNAAAIINANPAGTTFDWAAGLHRENAATLPTRTGDQHIGAAPDGNGDPTTFIKGSLELTSWTFDAGEGKWWHTVTQRGDGGTGSGIPEANGQHLNTEGLFRDGEWLWRVSTLAAVQGTSFDHPGTGTNWYRWTYPATWYFDEAADRVWIGFNPAGFLMEISVNARLFQGADDLLLQDLDVAQFANQAQCGPIGGASGVDTGDGWELDNVRAHHCHGGGVGPHNDWYIHDTEIYRNGQIGISTNVNEIELGFCRLYENNLAGFATGWEAGGFKIAFSGTPSHTGIRAFVHDCEIFDNNGPDAWTDIDNHEYLIELTYVHGGNSTGIKHEISYECEIRYCVVLACADNEDETAFGNGPFLGLGNIEIQNSSGADVHDNYSKIGGAITSGSGDEAPLALFTMNQNRGSGDDGTYVVDGCLFYDNVIELLDDDHVACSAKADFGDVMHRANQAWDDNDYYMAGGDSWSTAGFRFAFAGKQTPTGWRDTHGQDTFASGATFNDQAFSRAATLSGTLFGATEAEIVAGGKTLIYTLNGGDFFNSRIGSDTAETQALIDHCLASSSPAGGWNDQVVPALSFANVTRNSAHQVTITLPAVAGYSISGDEAIDAIVAPAESLVTRSDLSPSGSTPTVTASGGSVRQFTATLSGAGSLSGALDRTVGLAGTLAGAGSLSGDLAIVGAPGQEPQTGGPPGQWTTPRTWVDGEVETTTIFNTAIRDNIDFLGRTHDHSGDAGDGADLVGDSVLAAQVYDGHRTDAR